MSAVPDWAGLSGTDTATRYLNMAADVRATSPTYERLCLGVADDPQLLARLDALPVDKRQPNLLLGATRLLGGPVESYPRFREWVLGSWPDVAATMLARRTQTNEPGRCATLLPALAALPQPIALLEVGASAGLCLYPDRYAYRYDAHVVGSATVEFPCRVSGAAPLPSRLPIVAWRAGLDLNPLDVGDDADVRWLEALVWPEDVERLARVRAAVSVVRADPPRVVRGDLLRDLTALVAQAPADATLVVFHSAVLAYLTPQDRERFAATVSDLDAVWLSNEAPGVVPGTDLDTGGRRAFVLARDGIPLAVAGSHGQSLDWIAA